MLNKRRRVGHWQVAALQFLRRDERRLRLPGSAADLQPHDLEMTNFSYSPALQMNPIFSNQTTTFLEKNIDLSVPNDKMNLRVETVLQTNG